MAKKSKRPSTARSASAIKVRQVKNQNEWELVHPRSAIQRADDIEEVRTMIAAGEYEIAQDELLWLLGGCHDFIEAHRLLGELALTDGDTNLARGHFGIAFTLGDKAAKTVRGKFPYTQEANRHWLESGKGLLYCLIEKGELTQFNEVKKKLLKYDSSDPLDIKSLSATESIQQPDAQSFVEFKVVDFKKDNNDRDE